MPTCPLTKQLNSPAFLDYNTIHIYQRVGGLYGTGMPVNLTNNTAQNTYTYLGLYLTILSKYIHTPFGNYKTANSSLLLLLLWFCFLLYTCIYGMQVYRHVKSVDVYQQVCSVSTNHRHPQLRQYGHRKSHLGYLHCHCSHN